MQQAEAMTPFTIHNDRLFAEKVDISALAKEIGTPFYCYSASHFTQQYKTLVDGLAGLNTTICFAVKATPNIAILARLGKQGAGADIVSQGELHRALKAGIAPEKIVFSGVGKSRAEIAAGLKAGIGQFNVESLAELETLAELAAGQNTKANIAFRLNPDIDANTHEKITTGKAGNKFGLAWDEARHAFARAKELDHINATGLAIHIGSQIMTLAPFTKAFEKLAVLYNELTMAGHQIESLDIGGGLGVAYHNDMSHPSIADYTALVQRIFGRLNCRLIVEPGRLIAANGGMLVTSVIRSKKTRERNFIIIDAAMTELMRPTLYDAHHDILPVAAREGEALLWDIVGAVCESGDFLGRDRLLPTPQEGDLLAIFSTGAYGASLASQYNSRPLAPEILVDGTNHYIIRERGVLDTMLATEHIPPTDKT